MVNNEERFVTRKEWDEHLNDTIESYGRLTKLEAEIMGDPTTGRPSLRVEIKNDLDHINGKVDGLKKDVKDVPVLKRLIWAVLTLVVLGGVGQLVKFLQTP